MKSRKPTFVVAGSRHSFVRPEVRKQSPTDENRFFNLVVGSAVQADHRVEQVKSRYLEVQMPSRQFARICVFLLGPSDATDTQTRCRSARLQGAYPDMDLRRTNASPSGRTVPT